VGLRNDWEGAHREKQLVMLTFEMPRDINMSVQLWIFSKSPSGNVVFSKLDSSVYPKVSKL